MAEAMCYSKCEFLNKRKQGSNKELTNRKQLKILIVDDDIDIATTFGEILECRGHTVTTVNEGIKCISKCQNNFYDVIFMDFHLTDDKIEFDETNGAEITDLLKTVCSVNSIVVAITGDNSLLAINKFKDVGMYGALIKPFCIETINNLMNLLESRKISNSKNLKPSGDLKLNTNLIIF